MSLQFADAQPAWSRTEIDPQRLWPTLAEERALQAAKRRALGEETQPKAEWGVGYFKGAWGPHDKCVDKFGGTGGAKVHDGTDNYAVVHWRRGMGFSSAICSPAHPIDIHGTDLKRWDGVPRLVRQGAPQQSNHSTQPGFVTEAREQWVTPQAIREQGNMKRGQVDIRAHERQVHYVYEDIDIVHQRRFRHVNAPDQHSNHGAPPETVQIAAQQTQVNVHQSGRVIERHHEAPQTLISALLFGVRKQPQEARQAQQAALPAPQAINRGVLLPAPQQPQQRQAPPQPLAIAHQPGIPMEAPKKKAGFWS